MPLFMTALKYSADSTKALVDKPQDRRVAARAALEAIGCTLKDFYFAFGAADVIVIYEAPDAASAAAVSMAVGASGAATSAETTQLLTMEEAMSAMAKAGQIRQTYIPPGFVVATWSTRGEYKVYGATDEVLPKSAAEAHGPIGVAILGPIAFTASHPGAELKMHLSLNGRLSEDNEFVAAIFRVGDPQPVAVATRPGLADEPLTIEETFTVEAKAAGDPKYLVRVGLEHPGGKLFLNGDANGLDPALPACFLEITEMT